VSMDGKYRCHFIELWVALRRPEPSALSTLAAPSLCLKMVGGS
jgi:hypothetical protein